MRELLLVVTLGISSACSAPTGNAPKLSHNSPETPLPARSRTYRCIVREARELTAIGTLVEMPPAMRAQTVNKTFDVDQITGIIDGAVGNNWSFESQQVLFTPPGNPFYVVSITRGPNKNVDLLTIRDWAEASDKPFVLAQSSYVFSGTCRKAL